MLWEEWLIDENKTLIKTKVNEGLKTTQYTTQDIIDSIWNLLFEMLTNNYVGRKLWCTTATEMNSKAVNIFVEHLPNVLEIWKKYTLKDKFFDPEMFGRKDKANVTNTSGNVPSVSAVDDPFDNSSFTSNEKTLGQNEVSSYNYIDSVRQVANSLFWQTGVYDNIISAFHPYIIQYETGSVTLW